MQSLAKGKIHWLCTQTIEIKAFEKGQKKFTINKNAYWSHMSIYSFNLERCLCTASIVSFVPQSLRIKGRMQIFRKMSQKALNRVLIVPKERAREILPIPLNIMDLQNVSISVVKNIEHIQFRSKCDIFRFGNDISLIKVWLATHSN